MVGCYTHEHPSAIDTIFLDSLPPSGGGEPIAGLHRVVIYPFSSDAPVDSSHTMPVTMEWRLDGSVITMLWENHFTPVRITGRASPDGFNAQAILFSDYLREVQDDNGHSFQAVAETTQVVFRRIDCPPNWRSRPGAGASPPA